MEPGARGMAQSLHGGDLAGGGRVPVAGDGPGRGQVTKQFVEYWLTGQEENLLQAVKTDGCLFIIAKRRSAGCFYEMALSGEWADEKQWH